MSNIAIRCEALSKQYRIGKRERYKALRDVLTDALSAPFRHLRSSIRNSSGPRPPATDPETFWALNDVSFEVRNGEVVGIIGRNGAGKSTLLKILSRITEPTRGFAEINGRVGSLLEVGTGFHPELTGRENIYLNGAILGMKRAEIERRFDEIVDFAETEKFLDTPVKYYSSGMHVRLAFAVAAHLEPEILLVDEVLAVGDAAFQKKCLGKIGQVSKEGRTVLFVSHNLAMVQSLCKKVALLSDGRLVEFGPSADMLKLYCMPVDGIRRTSLDQVADRQGGGDIRLTEIAVLTETLRTGGPLRVEIHFNVENPAVRVKNVGVSIWTAMDERLISLDMQSTNRRPFELKDHVVCTLPLLPLIHGSYWLNVHIDSTEGLADYVVHALALNVEDSDYYGTGKGPHPAWGRIVTPCEWGVLSEHASL